MNVTENSEIAFRDNRAYDLWTDPFAVSQFADWATRRVTAI